MSDETLDVATAEAARFWYRAKYVCNHDGDTLDVDLDLGFQFTWRMRIRMIGINAPELSTGARGQLSRDWLTKLLTGRSFYVRTEKDKADKYGGRWDAEIWAPIVSPDDKANARIADEITPETPLVSVNKLMLTHGLAVAYNP